jgi:hypothetical protein
VIEDISPTNIFLGFVSVYSVVDLSWGWSVNELLPGICGIVGRFFLDIIQSIKNV